MVEYVDHDEESGEILQLEPDVCTSWDLAMKKAKEMYLHFLKIWDLENNGCCDAKGEAACGGSYDPVTGESELYACPEYAIGCLVMVARITITKIIAS